MTTLKAAIQKAVLALTTSTSPRLDAELLLSYVLNKSRTYLLSHSEDNLPSAQLTAFNNLLTQRQAGVPMAYLLGEKEFWSLTFQVNEHTLIPRPDTECLVSTLLERLPDSDTPKDILELGTGSGAIACSLAVERPTWSITATDLNPDTLAMAKQNANANHCQHIDFIQSNWFDSIAQQKFHAIVANPPYVAENDPHLSEGDVRFEPKEALVSGTDGLDDIRLIIRHSPQYLHPNGLLLLEHGYDQGDAVIRLFEAQRFNKIERIHDLAGHHRATLGFFSVD